MRRARLSLLLVAACGFPAVAAEPGRPLVYQDPTGKPGAGSELTRRVAVPMVGGMASSALLTLLVIPAIYAGVKGFGLPRTEVAAERGGVRHLIQRGQT